MLSAVSETVSVARNCRGDFTSLATSHYNRLQSGQVVYNVTIDRLWKDDDQANEGGEVIKKGEWHQSQSFGRDDLLIVAKVADLCHTWIYRKIQDQAREQSF